MSKRFADPQKLLSDIYQLRYQVYCNECSFINPEDYPNQKENDRFDPYSVHFVIGDSDNVVGTARLILDNPYGFPLEDRCKGAITKDLSHIKRKHLAEISRVAVTKRYKRKDGDGLCYPQHFFNKGNEHHRKPSKARLRPLAIGLYRLIYQECRKRGLTHCLVLMEKPLWFLLRQHHFTFHPIGHEIDYFGPVRPYMISVSELEHNLAAKSPKLYLYMIAGLAPEHMKGLPLLPVSF